MADVHGVGDEEEDSLAIGTILNEFVIGNTDEGSSRCYPLICIRR